ncbi:MAG: hypothetical protein EOP91_04455 [Lysobacteraceae bacterium]|nr:MAG: hypothetical protein EOP91_04455 [Xanthomonadaceae bacterium]
MKQTLGQPFDFTALSNFNTHVVIDVAGYFMAPEATRPDCTAISDTRTLAAGENSYGTYADAAACPAGYAPTTPYCLGATGVYLTGSGVWSNSPYDKVWCSFHNTTASSQVVIEGTTCCRVPGR